MKPLNPYSARLNTYGAVQSRPDVQPSRPAQRSAATVAAAAPKATQAGSLSRDEQQFIDRYFPETPDLSLRIYGRTRDAQTLNPAALGSRLDISG